MEKIDIGIIGSGAAGMTAAIYAKRAGLNIKLFEKLVVGGTMINIPKIENFPSYINISGADLAMKMYEQIVSLGIEVIYESIEELDVDTKILKTKSHHYEAKAIIIATGTSKLKIKVSNSEKLKGISYCVTCDGAFYKNKVVAIYCHIRKDINEIMYLLNLVKKLYVITTDKKTEIELLKNKKIKIYFKNEIIKLNGDPINEIIIRDIKDIENKIPIDGLFVCAAQRPNNELVVDKCELDKRGYIKTNDNMETSIKGIYAVGDIRSKKLRQIINACSEGAIAITNIMKNIIK